MSAVFSQARLVLNGAGGTAYITINNGAHLVVDNPSDDAITRNSGWIISESENNRIKWNIANATGNYTIPWGYGNTAYIPFQFTIASPGSSNGSFVFSTYRTHTWENSSNLPTGVPNVNSAIRGGDASAYVVDRFWGIDASSYTTRPDLTQVVFTYADGSSGDIAAGNALSEANLQAQRWNSGLADWEGLLWGLPSAAANTVTISEVKKGDLYQWWTLVDLSIPLPVELMYFSVTCKNGRPSLHWTTASETNSDYFVVERSDDARHYEQIALIDAAGTSQTPRTYSYSETEGEQASYYYRLRQVDGDGQSHRSSIIHTQGCSQATSDYIWSHQNTIHFQSGERVNTVANVKIYDVQGREVGSGPVKVEQGTFALATHLPTAVYYVIVRCNQRITSRKVALGK